MQGDLLRSIFMGPGGPRTEKHSGALAMVWSTPPHGLNLCGLCRLVQWQQPWQHIAPRLTMWDTVNWESLHMHVREAWQCMLGRASVSTFVEPLKILSGAFPWASTVPHFQPVLQLQQHRRIHCPLWPHVGLGQDTHPSWHPVMNCEVHGNRGTVAKYHDSNDQYTPHPTPPHLTFLPPMLLPQAAARMRMLYLVRLQLEPRRCSGPRCLQPRWQGTHTRPTALRRRWLPHPGHKALRAAPLL